MKLSKEQTIYCDRRIHSQYAWTNPAIFTIRCNTYK